MEQSLFLVSREISTSVPSKQTAKKDTRAFWLISLTGCAFYINESLFYGPYVSGLYRDMKND